MRASGLWPSRPSSSAQHFLGARDDGGGQAREFRDMDAVGAVGRAGRDFVQEDDGVVPFAHAHRHAGERRQAAPPAPSSRDNASRTARGDLFFSCRCSTAAQAMARPSKVAVPRPISSRMTRLRSRRLVEDRRRLHHLDHEGRTAAREIVGRADAAEQASTMPICADSAGTNAPICARIAISAFWRRNVDLPAMFGPVTSQMRRARPATDRNRWARKAPA